MTGLLRTLQRSEAVISHTACPVPFTPSDTPSYSTLHWSMLNVLPWVCTTEWQLLQRFKGAHCILEPLSTCSDIQKVKNLHCLSFFCGLMLFFLSLLLFPIFLWENYIDYFRALLHLWPLNKETKQREKKEYSYYLLVYSTCIELNSEQYLI